MSSSGSSNGGVHILVFPYPAQGHMLPLLDLTHQLSLRGLTITIIITPRNLPILTPLLSSSPSIQTLVLPFPDHPELPPGVENVKDIGNHGNLPIMAALSKLQDPITQWFTSHPDPPLALISDFFLGWTHHMAVDQLRIPRICFYSSGAFVVAAFDHLWANYDSLKPGTDVMFDELPGVPSFSWDQLPSLFRRCKDLERTDKNGAGFIKSSLAANALSWASVFNSFWALEDLFLEFLQRKMGHPRVYSVGPLNLVAESGQLRAGDDDDDDERVISWLDRCEDGSVLYVCFGSQKLLTTAQAEALAVGLERSRVRFVWVVKPLSDGYGSVPDGFESRVSGRGLVLKGWAPQTAILSHRAVGGFLSHCGWNSVLEAMTAGVMILGWPMEADQFGNARLLVEYKGAAVVVCEGGDTVPDSTELARIINESMHGDVSPRSRAKELRKQGLEAVKVGGRSIEDMDKLVQEVSLLKVKNVVN